MFDLDVPFDTVKRQPQILDKIYELGYRSIAISEECDGNLKKVKPCAIPCAKYMNEFNKNIIEQNTPAITASQLNPNNHVLNVYSRLNIQMDNPAQNYSITNQAIIETYTLIALKPTTEKLFQIACQSEVDVIMLDFSVKLPFHLKQTNVNMAIQRGIVFEISYGQSIRDASSRKNVIANAMELVKKTKGKNIIISSACRDILELRGVFDVINLSTLFSLNPNQARDAISINSKKAVFHGISRQESFRGMTSFEKVDDVPESKQWKVQRLKESIDVHNKG